MGAASQAELQLLLPPFSISLKEEREGGSSDSSCLQRRWWRGGRNRERRELLFLSGIIILSWEGSDFVPILGGLIIFLSSPLLPLPSTLSLNKISFAVEAIPDCLVACSSSAPHERSTPHLQVQLVFPPIFLLPRLVTSAPPPWLHAAAAAGADEFLISCSRMKNTLNSGSLAVLGFAGCSCFLGLAELVGCCCFFSLNLEEKIEL